MYAITHKGTTCKLLTYGHLDMRAALHYFASPILQSTTYRWKSCFHGLWKWTEKKGRGIIHFMGLWCHSVKDTVASANPKFQVFIHLTIWMFAIQNFKDFTPGYEKWRWSFYYVMVTVVKVSSLVIYHCNEWLFINKVSNWCSHFEFIFRWYVLDACVGEFVSSLNPQRVRRHCTF